MKYSKRLKLISLVLLIGLVIFLFYKGLLIYRFRILPKAPQEISLSPDYYDYGGIFHCHSFYSDGSGSIEEIMQVANETGAKFLILTDHNTRQTLREGKEGWYGGCLLLIGEEISTFAGHYVGLDIPSSAFKFSPEAQATIDDVTELGGFGIIAHPFNTYRYQWTDWSVKGFQGMELINIDSQWRDEPFYRLFWGLLTYKVNPLYVLLSTFDYPIANLEKWDQLIRERPLIGIGASDAHQKAHLFGDMWLKFPSYKSIFSLAQIHVLTSQSMIKELPPDKENIYQALRNGNCYICIEGLAESNGFIFQAVCKDDEAIMGDTLLFRDYADLTIAHSFPAEAEIILIKDGKQIAKCPDNTLQYRAHEPGIYRVEIWPEQRYFPKGKHFPWIISNPIYLREPKYFEKKTAQDFTKKFNDIDLPCQLILEDFEEFPEKSSFNFEHDSRSSIDEKNAIESDSPIENSSKALKMSFYLAQTTEKNKEVWCALGERRERDLSNYKGISFYAKGDKAYRLAFQLRERDSGGGEERIEQWETTVKVRTSWEKKVIYFKDLYLVSKGTNGRKELTKVKGLFFIIDQSNTNPDTEGIIYLDELCLF